MKVIVLGSGVIGASTAYYLALSGAEVTVLERQAGPGLETSFANAGQVSPGYSTPWAAPGIPLKALKWLFKKHAPLAINLDGSLFQLQWMASMLSNCSPAHYAINKERMMRLSEYSRDCLRKLRADTGIEYEARSLGTLQLFRTLTQLESAQRDIAVLKECGVPYQLLDPNQLSSAEPALEAVRNKLTGGLRLPNDETGDCHLFTQEITKLAQKIGVDFQFNQSVGALLTDGNSITGVKVGERVLKADRYVVAFGCYSREFAAPLGLKLPVYPLKGYSLTLPLLDASKSPTSTILDETYKIAVTRFDNRIRVGGMAELNGFDLKKNPRRRETLELVVNDLFPGGGDTLKAEFWTGLRPMTPDGTPIVGKTQFGNLFLNTGHGTLGWTMACGSGKLIADLVTGQTPEINTEGLALDRYETSRRSAVSVPSSVSSNRINA